jgi:hypothetical protein
MKAFLLSVLAFLSLNTLAQKAINTSLKQQLDSILITDQGILNYPRTLLDENPWAAMQKIDSINVEKIEQIIAKYGYPGKTMVGEPQNTVVFYVIQHSDKIAKYYHLIEKAGKSGELPFKYTAMMLDRKLTGEGKEQIYGTQAYTQMIKNPETGKEEPFKYILPIKDPKNVNERRKKAGFDTTVEVNALRFGIVYKPYTLAEIKTITKQEK